MNEKVTQKQRDEFELIEPFCRANISDKRTKKMRLESLVAHYLVMRGH